MKWIYSLLALAAFQTVSAAPSIEKRAAANDVATVGYATLNGGTSGGSGGTTTTVTTLAALTAAVAGSAKKIVIISGSLTGAAIVRPGPNTTLLGKSGATLNGIGIRIIDVSNVIVRNIIIKKVLADTGDALAVQNASQVWIDHVDLSSDLSHDKDYYDGLLDLTHGVTGITVTYSKLHDHYKGSLVGHSDSNSSEDTKITVSYAWNSFVNINSRTPSFRFGRGHIWNNFFDGNGDGINTRVGAQLLVENNKWTSNNKNAIYSTSSGYAVARGNDFGGLTNTAPVGTFTTAPYSYTLLAASAVQGAVSSAGATLSF